MLAGALMLHAWGVMSTCASSKESASWSGCDHTPDVAASMVGRTSARSTCTHIAGDAGVVHFCC